MKELLSFVKTAMILLLAFAFSLAACGRSATPQVGGAQANAGSSGADATSDESSGGQLSVAELLSLGEKYLLELDYEQAIVYFSRVIEIEPRNARAYVGRGTAYVLWNEQLTPAMADFERAIEIDEGYADAYLGLIDIYIRMNDFDKALEIAELGFERTGSDAIRAKIDELTGGDVRDSSNQVRMRRTFSPDGVLLHYMISDYTAAGRFSGWTLYNADGTVSTRGELIFDEHGREVRRNIYGPDWALGNYDMVTYNDDGTEAELLRYDANDSLVGIIRFEYDSRGVQTGYRSYDGSNVLEGYWVFEFDENGRKVRELHYNPDGTLFSVTTME